MFVSVSMFAQSPLKKMTKVDVNPLTERTVTKAQTTRISTGMAKAKAMQLKRMRQIIILIMLIVPII
mgnify:CR=1 FL=1